MIIYQETIGSFIDTCQKGLIADRILSSARICGLPAGSPAEFHSWANSLPEIGKALDDPEIDKSIDVAVEYKLIGTKQRIDFLVYGLDESLKKNIVVVELKQWGEAQPSKLKEHVFANVAGMTFDDHWHPSYQALNYANILKDFNTYVYTNDVHMESCSYCHNMDEAYGFLMKDTKKFPLLSESPVFLKEDKKALCDFIHRYVKKPYKELLYQIDGAEIKPSLQFARMIHDAIQGKPFLSYDREQAYSVDKIVQEVRDSKLSGERKTIIVKGGPGTGKSVVAINVLGQLTGSEITEERLNACYVSSNYTPRTYYGEVLTDGDFRKNAVQELFKTPAAFAKARDKDYDCIIVDEAHRMYTWKFGLGLKKSVDVIDTLFKASLVNVFFLDENQEVTTSDYLTEDKIRMYASRYGSEVIAGDKLTLTSQFRCAGGQQYIDYVEHFLGYNHNPVNLRGMRYEFRIFDSIKDMVEAIHKKQERPETEKSRILSGYTKAHNWVSKDDSNAFDFDYPEEGVKLQWNKTVSGRAAVMEESQKDRVFYVNMVQGVDLDYAGVILCRDVRYENGEVTFHQEEDADTDGFSGIRACKDKEKAIQLIRNSYRVLLTRGTRGTYLYVEDPALREHLKNLAKN